MNSEKIDNIDRLINEQNRTLRSGIRNRTWVMAGLLVFVIGYMSFITITLARTVTPDSVSDVMVGTMVGNAPAARQSLITAAESSIPLVVDSGISQIYSLMPEVRRLMLHQVEMSLPRLSEDFYQLLARDIDRYFSLHDEVTDSLIEKIDNREKREKLLKNMEVVLKRDIAIFIAEAIRETRSLQGRLKTLIETPENQLNAEEKKMKEMLIYFLYLIKSEAGVT